jgi:hypothetical protein
MWRYHAKKMFIFIVQTLQNKWNEICMKQLAGGKHMENDCFPRTLKFEMDPCQQKNSQLYIHTYKCRVGIWAKHVQLDLEVVHKRSKKRRLPINFH